MGLIGGGAQAEYPTDVVFLVVRWRLRYTLSLRDLAEMFLERGFVFTYETVREWERRFAPRIAEQLRAKRRGQAGPSWYVDEMYVRVKGKWWYLSRALDADGNLVDSRRIRETRYGGTTRVCASRLSSLLAMLRNG
jgi:transposase-like protein